MPLGAAEEHEQASQAIVRALLAYAEQRRDLLATVESVVISRTADDKHLQVSLVLCDDADLGPWSAFAAEHASLVEQRAYVVIPMRGVSA